ncbi:hypothetical protein ACHAPO_010481 [Fusarium lateritium]
MISCMLHIFYRYEWWWGYQTWVWIAFAIWIFDQFLARPLRLMRNGVQRAHVTVIDGDYLQDTISRVRAKGHVYVYFPSLTVELPNGYNDGNEAKQDSTVMDLELHEREADVAGLVIFVRRHGGLASLLATSNSDSGIPVLIEGSYGGHTSVIRSCLPEPSIEYPNIICIAGGVGISGVLPCLDIPPSLTNLECKQKLLWGVRTEPLVEAVRNFVHRVTESADGREFWNNFEVDITVAKRFDINTTLQKELRGVVGGTKVIVCGPPEMADDVRVSVTRPGKQGFVIKLVEEIFVL